MDLKSKLETFGKLKPEAPTKTFKPTSTMPELTYKDIRHSVKWREGVNRFEAYSHFLIRGAKVEYGIAMHDITGQTFALQNESYYDAEANDIFRRYNLTPQNIPEPDWDRKGYEAVYINRTKVILWPGARYEIASDTITFLPPTYGRPCYLRTYVFVDNLGREAVVHIISPELDRQVYHISDRVFRVLTLV